MYRSCTSEFADVRAGFLRSLGNDEHELSLDLRTCNDEVMSERECEQQAAESLEICRSELHECEALHRDAQTKLHETRRSESEECSALRAEMRAHAAEMQLRQQNMIEAAQHEVAEAKRESLAEGARKGEEFMMSQYEEALARAVQWGREEGSARIRAELAEASQSLRDQLHVAEQAQHWTALDLAAEKCKSSRHKEETAQEVAELRNELSCARMEGVGRRVTNNIALDRLRGIQEFACARRQEGVGRSKTNKIALDYLRDVDVTRQKRVHLNEEDRGSESSAEFIMRNANARCFETACDSYVLHSDAVATRRSENIRATRTDDLHENWAMSSPPTHAKLVQAVLQSIANMPRKPKVNPRCEFSSAASERHPIVSVAKSRQSRRERRITRKKGEVPVAASSSP
eukprot:TRINITY_DN10588_c0_g1_i1.p1 TRINITY_DN10588_c0_g1~~TRINITY_DN10588_c0_g1_i1.p1  ORF type:complete len:403 (-),score=55.91 TRINITY_DN10588_c0_g1_i1:406-1614(-)